MKQKVAKFKWKKEPKEKGKWGWVLNKKFQNFNCSVVSLPGFEISDNECGMIMETGKGFEKEEWEILFYAKESILFEKKYDSVELAKKAFEELFTKILNTNELFDFQTRILNLGRIKLVEKNS